MISYTFPSPPSQTTTWHTFKRRASLPLSENVLWQLESGAVRTLTFTEEGTIIPLGFWGVGDIVGQPLSRIQPYQIECLTAVTALAMAPNECRSLDRVMLKHIHQMEELLRIRSGQVQQRLLQLLNWLAQKFGRQTTQGQQIELRLTHQDIADVVGTTRVTITRLMGALEREGIINCSRQNTILLQY
jgi:CRP-like cAMP-binding protein